MSLELADESEVQKIILRAKHSLADKLKRSPMSLPDPTVESTVWTDTAMHIHPTPKEEIRHGHFPGYVLIFRVGGDFYRYHAIPEGPLKCDSRHPRY